jgi:hypothetical protein
MRHLIAVLFFCSAAAGQFNSRKSEEKPYISKYYIADAVPGSTFETGSLHIVYSDRSEVIQEIPAKKASTETDTVFNQEGFSDVQLAEDRETIGWAEMYDNCCTSYSVPLAIVLYRSGKVRCHLQTGQMVWSWMFLEGGKDAAIVWGPTHGPEVGDYRLYDVRNCKVLSQVYGDAETQTLKPDAPKWAKNLQAKMRKPVEK